MPQSPRGTGLALSGVMDPRRLMVLLAGQIEVLRRQSESHPDWQARMAQSVLRGLRTTYLLLSIGVDPLREPFDGFVLEMRDSGEPLLRHGRLPVPVDGAALYRRLRAAGVDLHGELAVVVEPDLVRDAVDDGLRALAGEQARLTRDRDRLSAEIMKSLPRDREDLVLELHRLHAMTGELWARKIELTAASLVVEEMAA